MNRGLHGIVKQGVYWHILYILGVVSDNKIVKNVRDQSISMFTDMKNLVYVHVWDLLYQCIGMDRSITNNSISSNYRSLNLKVKTIL